MKPEEKLKAYPLTIENELFSGNNKVSGIYLIRNSSRQKIITAFAVSIFLLIIAVSLLAIQKKNVPAKMIKAPIGIITFDPLPSLPAPVKRPNFQVNIREPEIITKGDASSVKNIQLQADDGLKNTTLNNIEQKVQPGGVVQRHLGKAAEPVNIPNIGSNAEKQHLWVEEISQLMGGRNNLQSITTANMIYPEIAVSASTQGKALVTFIIEKDGTISHIKIVKGPGDSSDEVASRVKIILDKCKGGI